MSQSTRPKPGHSFGVADLADQAPALRAALQLAEQYPDLPSAYLTISWIYPGRLDMQLDSEAELLAWRRKLQPTAALSRRPLGKTRADVSFVFTIDSITVRVVAVLSVPTDGQLAEQQHQLLDAAAPPLACAAPVLAAAPVRPAVTA